MTSYTPNTWLNLWLDFRGFVVGLLVLLAALLGLPPAVPIALTAAYGATLVRPGLAALRRLRAAAVVRGHRLLARRARQRKARPERASRHTRA